jgi:hypothetical protein
MIDTQVLFGVTVISVLMILGSWGTYLITVIMQTIVFTGAGSRLGGCFTKKLFDPFYVNPCYKNTITNQINNRRNY